jgi:pimeloyl-ACP methyl ester carboxylesterase
MSPKTEVRYLDLRRGTLAWTQEGKGPTVVWAHGLLGDTSSLERMGVFDWAPLAAGNRLVRYDARGHGRSSAEPNPDDLTFASLADDLLALADAVQPAEPIAAVGCSMGTATILHAAVKMPSRFRRVVLTAPPTAWETRRGRASDYMQAADRIEREGEGAASDLIARFPRPAMFACLPSLTIEVDLRLVPTVLRGAGRSDLPAPESLRQLALPVLILAWQGDPAHPVATAERLVELIPNAQLRIAESLQEVHGWNELAARFLAE